MDDARRRALLESAGAEGAALQERIAAMDELGRHGDAEVVAALRRLLERRRPEPSESENWDPEAVERVVDLHIVGALCALGDASEIGRIAALVRRAGRVLQGLDDELENAAAVTRQVGRPDVIRQLVELTSDELPEVVRNAVVTLNLLRLPRAPVGGDVGALAPLEEEVTFRIERLSDELRALVRLSRGVIALSPGTSAALADEDHDRGAVLRERQALKRIVEEQLAELDFDYYVDDGRVVICTHAEAGHRWRAWWREHESELLTSWRTATRRS